MFECVVNISEGRDRALLERLASSVTLSLRDLHSDTFHNRSVFTLIAESGILEVDVRALITSAFESLDLSRHEGVHPRFGVVDVVPFVALEPSDQVETVALRDETARWIAATFDVPTFLYGPLGDTSRSLPEVRRGAFRSLAADFGPSRPSPSLGAVAVGARPVLVAWNLWLDGVSLADAGMIAAALRSPAVRALAFPVGDQVQVSCNLIDPLRVGPGEVDDEVQALLGPGGVVARAELVGLLPEAVLAREDPERWEALGLSPERTIEARLRA